MPQSVLLAHPSGELYGSDRVLVETVAGLVEAGWDVVVAIPGTGPLVALLVDAGATVVVVPTPVLRKAHLSPVGLARLVGATAAALGPSLRVLRRARPSAVVVNTITVPLWSVLARLSRVPVVWHVHEAEGSARPLVRRLLALPLHLAARIVCNSEFSRAVLVSSAPRLAARCEVVHNGVPGPAAPALPRADLAGSVRLLYLGRLSERKGVDVAVEAAARLRDRGTDVRLDVVGAVFAGYEWYEERLHRLVHERGLDAVVTFHGFDPDVWGHLARADVLLVPSLVDEPFGNTAVEGALAARPVVASATSGLLEATAGMRTARTVTPSDPDAVADAVAELMAGWDQVRVDVVLDRDRARTLYSPGTYARRMADLVAGVTGPPRTPDRGGPGG